jgi:hypothetical protein
MKNVNFLKEVLMSDAEYWIVEKRVEVINSGRTDRVDVDIIFIAIPRNIERNLKYEEITLQELEKLENSLCEQNIFMTNDFTPFQIGVRFYNLYSGYPITKNINKFLIDALNLKSENIWDYKKLIENEG